MLHLYNCSVLCSRSLEMVSEDWGIISVLQGQALFSLVFRGKNKLKRAGGNHG